MPLSMPKFCLSTYMGQLLGVHARFSRPLQQQLPTCHATGLLIEPLKLNGLETVASRLQGVHTALSGADLTQWGVQSMHAHCCRCWKRAKGSSKPGSGLT
jgi:hypothetical protein